MLYPVLHFDGRFSEIDVPEDQITLEIAEPIKQHIILDPKAPPPVWVAGQKETFKRKKVGFVVNGGRNLLEAQVFVSDKLASDLPKAQRPRAIEALVGQALPWILSYGQRQVNPNFKEGVHDQVRGP